MGNCWNGLKRRLGNCCSCFGRRGKGQDVSENQEARPEDNDATDNGEKTAKDNEAEKEKGRPAMSHYESLAAGFGMY
jgi:hypothetical protein